MCVSPGTAGTQRSKNDLLRPVIFSGSRTVTSHSWKSPEGGLLLSWIGAYEDIWKRWVRRRSTMTNSVDRSRIHSNGAAETTIARRDVSNQHRSVLEPVGVGVGRFTADGRWL